MFATTSGTILLPYGSRLARSANGFVVVHTICRPWAVLGALRTADLKADPGQNHDSPS